MMNGEVEATAAKLLREGGATGAGPLGVEELIRRLLGPKALRLAPQHVLLDEAALVRVGVEWRVYVRHGLALERARFSALHELAHWADPTASEDFCNRVAGALLLPRAAFLDAVQVRRRMLSVARSFGSDESCAWLRLGEATGEALALVTPRRVRVRGESFGWPGEPTLRELAARSRIPGLRKASLRDDKARSVLRAPAKPSSLVVGA